MEKHFNIFKVIAMLVLSFLLSSCAGIKLKKDFMPSKSSSQLIFRVHIDHDLNKQYDFEKNGYYSFDLTLGKFVEGEIEEEIRLPKIRNGELYVLNLDPAHYSLIKGRFNINGWRERYNPQNISFEIKEGILAYAGDIHIITKTYNNKAAGTLSGFSVSYNYTMKQFAIFNSETLKIFRELYPILASTREIETISSQSFQLSR